MQWSKYQQDIFSAVHDTSDSLIINAVAGSGKTSTLVEAVKYATGKVCLLAFNKAIADELKRRIAPPAVCMTLHAAGWAAWRQYLAWDAGECKVDGDKVSTIIHEKVKWDDRKRNPDLRKLVSLAKGSGIVPGDKGTGIEIAGQLYQGLVDDDDESWMALMDHYGIDPDDANIDIARRVLAESIAWSRECVDFDDMLYLPVVSGAAFEHYDTVFLDEAQDVSGIQMEMVRRMVGGGAVRCECPSYYDHDDKGQAPLADFCPVHGLDEYRKQAGGRVIAVGDRHQAIYGFRGAHAGSMDRIKERFDCQELPLSVSYRCPRLIVEHARQWVSHLEFADGAEDGSCGNKEHPVEWALTDYTPGDAVLCRINRPLVSLTFSLIRAKVPAKMLGRDIGQGIVKLAKRIDKDVKPRNGISSWRDTFECSLEAYRVRERNRLAKRKEWSLIAGMNDRLDTLMVFVNELTDGDGLDDLIASIERLFGDNGQVRGCVTLSTIHKAKGLEWDRVFILDAHLYQPPFWAREGWQMDQERNLSYVAATRAKRELRYVASDADFESKGDNHVEVSDVSRE